MGLVAPPPCPLPEGRGDGYRCPSVLAFACSTGKSHLAGLPLFLLPPLPSGERAGLRGPPRTSPPFPNGAPSMSIIRRDPRREWIARNRLHPLHASIASSAEAEVRWMGPQWPGPQESPCRGGRFRRPPGRQAIDRSGAHRARPPWRRPGGGRTAAAGKHRIAEPAFHIAVFRPGQRSPDRP